jgi:hypothetical protein
MVSFRTKNPNLGKILRALDGKMLIYFRAFGKIFMGIWDILLPFYFYFILCSFGTFFLVLVSCTKKNLATPIPTFNWLAFI